MSDLFVHLQTGYWQGKKKGKLLTSVEYLPVSDVAFSICYVILTKALPIVSYADYFSDEESLSHGDYETSQDPVFTSRVNGCPNHDTILLLICEGMLSPLVKIYECFEYH